jgi:hypothetical protein
MYTQGERAVISYKTSGYNNTNPTNLVELTTAVLRLISIRKCHDAEFTLSLVTIIELL